MFNLIGQKKPELVVVIDLGSGSAGLAILELNKKEVPRVLFSLRQELNIQKKLTSERLLFATVKSLESMIGEMQKTTGHHPDQVYCFLSPHLLASQTRTIRAVYDKTTHITERIISDLVRSERDIFQKESLNGNSEDGVVFIEEKIMRLTLNGYEVENYVNKFAKEVEVAVHFSFSSRDVIEPITHAVTDAFHGSIPIFNCFPFAYFNSVRDIFADSKQFICVDIGSEISDLSLVRDGVLESSASFPVGKNTIFRLLGESNGGEKILLNSLIGLNNAKKLTIEEGAIINRRLIVASSKWIDGVKMAIEEIAQKSRIPKIIYLLSDIDVAPIFKNILSKIDLVEYSILNKQPEIRSLSSADFTNFCDNKGGMPADPFIMIAAIYLNKIFNN